MALGRRIMGFGELRVVEAMKIAGKPLTEEQLRALRTLLPGREPEDIYTGEYFARVKQIDREIKRRRR